MEQLLIKRSSRGEKGLKTGEDEVYTFGTPLGTYKVVEVKSTWKFCMQGRIPDSYLVPAQDRMKEVVFEIVTFVNDRRKQVSVRKEDQDTENPLAGGGIYGLYTAEDVYGKSENCW